MFITQCQSDILYFIIFYFLFAKLNSSLYSSHIAFDVCSWVVLGTLRMWSARFLNEVFPVDVYIVTDLTLNFVMCSVVINKRLGIHK